MVRDSEGVLLNSCLQGTRRGLSLGYLLTFHHKRGSGSSILSWTITLSGKHPTPRLPSFLEQSPSRTCGLILGILLLTQLFPKHELALNKAFVSGKQGRCFEPSPKAEKNHQRIFLPTSKGRKSSNTHIVQLLQGIFPTKMSSLPRK